MARGRNPNIVRANEEVYYTANDVKELQKCMQDPIYMIKTYGRIQHPIHGQIPFSLYDYQEEMINNFVNNRYCIVLSARQSGKSWVSAAYLLWFAMFNNDKTVFIVSNKNENAMEMIDRIQYLYEHLPAFLKPGIVDDGWNKHNVKFDNRSEIISTATTETSGRGYSISLLFCDEFAFVRPGIQDAFWSSINPTLSTGGRCIIASTPNGDTNLFATLWRGAELQTNTFKSQWVKWDQPPGRDQTFKLREIGNIGEDKWKQEYECEFLSSDALLFNSLVLSTLKTPSLPEPNERGIRVWSPFERGKTYLIGIDPSTGSGLDYSVIQAFLFPELLQVMEFRSNTTSSPQLYLTLKFMLKQVQRAQAQAYFSVENNGVGEGIISLYQADEEIPEAGEFVSEPGRKRYGFTTTGKSKLKACINFKNLIERSKITIQSTILLKEMKNYIRKSGSYEANFGSTDDAISACLIVVRMLEEIASFEEAAYDALFSVDENEYFTTDPNEEEYNDENAEALPIIVGGNSISPYGSFSDPYDPDSFDPWGGR